MDEQIEDGPYSRIVFGVAQLGHRLFQRNGLVQAECRHNVASA